MPKVDVVDDRLQHGGDDGRAARAADGEGRLAVLEGDGRRHAAARALAGFRDVRAGPEKSKSVISLFSRKP
jgi:hypothetical protein